MACANVGGANPFVCVCVCVCVCVLCVCCVCVCVVCVCVLVCVAMVDLSPRSVCIRKGGVNPCVCAYHKHTYIYTHETSITSGQLKHTSSFLSICTQILVIYTHTHKHTHTSTSTYTQAQAHTHKHTHKHKRHAHTHTSLVIKN